MNPTPKPPRFASQNPRHSRRHCRAPSELELHRRAAVSSRLRRLRTIQEFRTEVVRLADLFSPPSRSVPPGSVRRRRRSNMRHRERRSARLSSRRCPRSIARAALMLPVLAALEIEHRTAVLAKSGDAPPPPAPPARPNPPRPSDLDPRVQIRSHLSHPSPYWSTAAPFAHKPLCFYVLEPVVLCC